MKRSTFQKIFLIKVLMGCLLVTLSGQTTEESLNLEIIELREKIDQLNADRKKEDSYFREFIQEKSKLKRSKQEQLSLIKKEIKLQKANLVNLKKQLGRIQSRINSEQKRRDTQVQILVDYTKELIEMVEKGIPWRMAERKSQLSALLLEISSSDLGMGEIFRRLNNFMDYEIKMGLNSEVIKTSYPINGKIQPVTMVRLGRIVFLVRSADDTYLFRPVKLHPNSKGDQNGYQLDPKGLGYETTRGVDRLIKMIEGRESPDLLSLPIPRELFEQVK